MAAGQQTPGKKLIQEAHPALDNMKYEIAQEFNLPVHQSSEDYWGNLTAKECGSVGGEMVKRMITSVQNQLIGK